MDLMSWPRRINVEKLKSNPVVESVNYKGIEFTLQFRIELFEKWKVRPTPDTIKNELEKVDILEQDLFSLTIKDISTAFTTGGYPIPRCKTHPEREPGYKETNPLILSGKFYRKQKGFGITIDLGFRQKLKDAYPDVSIEDMMSCNGLDPLDVGYNRIHRLELEFKSEMEADYAASEGTDVAEHPIEVSSACLLSHPYVKAITRGSLYMTEAFYNEAYVIPMPLSKVLEIYGIDESLVNTASKMRISALLAGWKPVGKEDFSCAGEVIAIQRKRATAMFRAVKDGFCELGTMFRSTEVCGRRRICRWIDDLPRDPWGYFSRKKILELMGMSKSIFYALLNDENYGIRSTTRNQKDEEDIVIIRKVLEYKGFEKGIRQVYMLMPRVAGQTFSMYRIRRLMNKYGIRTTIRHPSKNRKAMKELMERNRKANLLMQRFRLHRPNEVRLTDVTYLDYGDDLRAYGSASVDPVTGRLVCFIVSENNDLQLALDTLEAMDSYPAKSGAILHSDQGLLYMTDDFQAAVVERKLQQSMSRRGNCWDNAVQESFFGHFKDECHYEKCETLEELQKCIDEYSYYYNNERGMWDRGRMTPAEYEKYLEGMTDAEFSEYLAVEENRYEEMKRQSAENAHKAAKEYREFTEKSIGGIDNETGGSFKEVQV